MDNHPQIRDARLPQSVANMLWGQGVKTMAARTDAGAQFHVFASYARQDRAIVERYVELFQKMGLSVWWDELIAEGRWGESVEAALDCSQHVVAFISEHSLKSGYVFVEARRARDRGVLVPVLIDDARINFEFEGLIALIQQYRLCGITHPQIEDSTLIRKLCAVCGASVGSRAEPANSKEDEQETVDEWLSVVNFKRDTSPCCWQLFGKGALPIMLLAFLAFMVRIHQ